MFSAFNSIFTPENLLFLLKGAMTSLGIAALSLLIGFVFGVLGASAKISNNKIFIHKLLNYEFDGKFVLQKK